MIQRNLQALVISVRTDRGIEFLNKTLYAFFKEEGIKHQTSTPRIPKQNGVVEIRNRTLVKVARTMLLASKLPLFDEIKEMTKTSVANDTSGPVPQRPTASDYDNSIPVPQLQNVSPSADTTVPSQQELDLLLVLCTMNFSIREAMDDYAWIEAMQEELHQFDRLQVWELIEKSFGKNVIKLK
ncbi:retrovirus-related pol polyprotein from transposon TNT 1-94 [Tanacetum coccineum]